MATSRISKVLHEGTTDSLPLPGDAPSAAMRAENDRLSMEVARLRLRVLDLERAADTDPLVPVYNRRAFMREVERAQTMVKRYDLLSTLIYFDLNNFKAINDQYGHAIGDELLLKTGQVLMSGVRDCDLVARLGGDEFGVLLFNTELAVARAKAELLSGLIAKECVDLPTAKVSVSTAWGIAVCEPSLAAEQVLSEADKAMYAAKRA